MIDYSNYSPEICVSYERLMQVFNANADQVALGKLVFYKSSRYMNQP